MNNMYLFFECEVDGLPLKWTRNPKKIIRPEIIRMSWAIYDTNGNLIDLQNHLIRRERTILKQTTQITGITPTLMRLHGQDRDVVFQQFFNAVDRVTHLVSYNINFELGMLSNDLTSEVLDAFIEGKKQICLMRQAVVREWKGSEEHVHYMSLSELYFNIYDKACNMNRTPFSELGIMADCYFGMKLAS